jgi:predicted PurR-regulated permease PerM
MQQKSDLSVSKITSLGGFILSIVVSIIYAVMYIRDDHATLDRRITVVETNQTYIAAELTEIKTEIRAQNEMMNKILILMPKNKKDEIIIE